MFAGILWRFPGSLAGTALTLQGLKPNSLFGFFRHDSSRALTHFASSFGTIEEAAEKGLNPSEMPEKHPSGAKARAILWRLRHE